MYRTNLGAVLFIATALPLSMTGQTPATTHSANKAARRPAPGAHIASFCMAERDPDSTYETGPLKIFYSDGTHLVERLPPKRKGGPHEIVSNQEGIEDPQVTDDGKTMGWLETFDNIGDSNYAFPFVVVIFRSGAIQRRIIPERIIWDWKFFDGGKTVGVSLGYPHGEAVADQYKLYDVNTGRLLAEAEVDAELEDLPPGAPEWAKQLEGKVAARSQDAPRCRE